MKRFDPSGPLTEQPMPAMGRQVGAKVGGDCNPPGAALTSLEIRPPTHTAK